jgi:putative nucleotidyltransferase with HDIG domain
MRQAAENVISVNQLQVGVYVYLDVGWMQHPFSFNNFKIRDEAQLKTIRELGLQRVRWDPARSDLKPLAKGAVPAVAPTEQGAPVAAEVTAATGAAHEAEHEAAQAAMMADKRARIQALTEHREKIAKVEQAFTNAANVARGIGKTIYSQPAKTVAEAGQLVGDMVEALLLAPDLAIQVMAEKPGAEDVYFHALNVSVLAMIIARELNLPADVVKLLGIGALFHDIGLNEVPAKILNNPGTLTKPERDFREMHCQYGLDIGKKAGLAQTALNIIYQHHEHFDGSGYPHKLKGEAIDPLARLVALVNAYDNLCNPMNITQALTPHEALSLMFSKHRALFDPKLLQVFIRFMGVYPPGTVVGLSNEALGLVIKVNATRALKPTVIVYDADIPKSEALILDLGDEPDINISRAIRPAQLPPAVFDYLSPRRRISYYFDAGTPGREP